MPLFDHYMSLAAFAYILSALFFAAVRWFHVCQPYQKQVDYYFPGRRVVVFFNLLTLITFPYVLWPSSPDAWLLVKSYFPLTQFFAAAVLIYRYFGSMKNWIKWKHLATIIALPLAIMLMVLFFNALSLDCPWGEKGHHYLSVVSIVLGLCASAFTYLSLRRLMMWLKQQKESDYFSNPDDFPSSYARKMLYIPVFFFIIIWAVFFSDSRLAMAALHLFYVVFNLCFLITILHSKREKSPFEWEEEKREDEQGKSSDFDNTSEEATVMADCPSSSGNKEKKGNVGIDDEKIALIVKEIRAFVEERSQYLNPHLTIADVAENCGYGRTYVSRVLTNEMGGFFHYVNTLRLQYANKYREEHPYATQDEVATASGFSSRQAFYAVRKRMG